MSIVKKSRRAGFAGPRHSGYWALLALTLAPLLAFLAAGGVPVARADGGAPNLLYVSGVKGGVAVVDIASQQVTDTIPVAGDPRGLVLSTDSRFLYVALAGKDGIAVIDAQAKKVINTYATGPGPQSLILDLIDPTNLWVANSGGDTVTVLNPDTGKKAATIPVGLHPVSVALAGPTSGINETDATSEALVANEDGASLTVIGSESFKVLETVPLPNDENPLWVTVPAFGGTAYVTTKQGHVFGFTLAGHEFFGPIFTGKALHGMDYDAITGQIYVPDSQTNQINVLRPVSSGQKPPTSLPSQPQRTIAVSGGPAFVAITSDGSLGLVGQQATGDVSFLDVPGHKLANSIHVGGTPQFVLAGPFPPLVNRQSAQVILIVIYVLAGILLVGGIVWLIWWMRKQERRIRELHAQEDAEYARHLLAEQERQAQGNGALPLAEPGGEPEAEEPGSAKTNGPPRRTTVSKPKTSPKKQQKR
jgi:YVTN family beta-propeller protein